ATSSTSRIPSEPRRCSASRNPLCGSTRSTRGRGTPRGATRSAPEAANRAIKPPAGGAKDPLMRTISVDGGRLWPAIRFRARTVLVGAGLVALTLARVGVAPVRASDAGRAWPLDFDLTWVAAHRLVAGESLYDR